MKKYFCYFLFGMFIICFFSCTTGLSEDEKETFKFVSEHIGNKDLEASKLIEGELFGESNITYICRIQDSAIFKEEFATYLNYFAGKFYQKRNNSDDFTLSLSISNGKDLLTQSYKKNEMEALASYIDLCEKFIESVSRDSVHGLNGYFVKGFERIDELEAGINKVNKEFGIIERYDLIKFEGVKDSNSDNKNTLNAKIIIKTFRNVGESEIILEVLRENNFTKIYSITI